MRETLYTKNDLKALLPLWGHHGDVPKKGEKLVITFPQEYLDTFVITWSEHVSDGGKRLYSVMMGKAEEFLENV